MTKKPKKRGLYAWNSIYAGSFLLFVKSFKDHYQFMFLPGPSEFNLTFDEFSSCVQKGILEFVEDLPEEIFQESLSAFELACPKPTLMMEPYETSKSK